MTTELVPLDRSPARRQRDIFSGAMRRATRLADDYVRALNLIDIEFLPRRFGSGKDRAVINAWRALFGELSQSIQVRDPTEQQRLTWHPLEHLEAALALAVALSMSLH